MADYDLVIIGSGPGGYVAALRAAQLGAEIGLIEERELGGVCLNRGCIPTKAILESAKVFSRAKGAAKFGIKCEAPEVDYPAIARRKQNITQRLSRGVGGLLKSAGVDVLTGRGSIIDASTVEVASDAGRARVSTKCILVATGSEAAKPGMFPFEHDRVITSDEALNLTELPASIIIVGGGYIGCEFASMWADLGSKVTVVEMLDGLIVETDEDLSKEMLKILKRKKVKVHVGTKIESLDATDTAARAQLPDGKTIEAEMVLVAVGRKLNSDVVGLAELGVEVENGAIVVDDFGRTNVDGIRAIGDVTGKCLLAHYASAQGIVAVEHLLGFAPEPISEDAIPACIFTNPEIATVGLTEGQARERHGDVKVGTFQMMALGKAQASSDTAGFVKVISAEEKIVGVHMVGHECTSMISEAALAVKLGLGPQSIIDTIHAHPTMPEALLEAVLDLEGRAIHKP